MHKRLIPSLKLPQIWQLTLCGKVGIPYEAIAAHVEKQFAGHWIFVGGFVVLAIAVLCTSGRGGDGYGAG